MSQLAGDRAERSARWLEQEQERVVVGANSICSVAGLEECRCAAAHGTGGIPPDHGQGRSSLRAAISRRLLELLSLTATAVEASWPERVRVVATASPGKRMSVAAGWQVEVHGSQVKQVGDLGGPPSDVSCVVMHAVGVTRRNKLLKARVPPRKLAATGDSVT